MDKTEIRKSIRDEFEYYLSNVAKSSRITANGYNLQNSAVTSYLLFIEPEKLFDYDPQKWKHIESLYDVTTPEDVETIIQILMADPAFKKRDKENNQGWRSGAIMHYSCFVRARSFFNQRDTVEEQSNDDKPHDMLSKLLLNYREDLPSFWEDERYKWEAVQYFQNNWNIDADDFGSMFKEATKKHVNLLDANRVYPIKMIQNFAEVNKEKTRDMFRFLFDEDKPLNERIAFFISEAEEMRLTRASEWNNHYQDLHTISVYLTFKYPQKYFIYKFKELRKSVKILGDDFSFEDKTKPKFYSNVVRYMNGIRKIIIADDKLCKVVDGLIQNDTNCYPDEQKSITTFDFIYYVGKRWKPEPEIVIKDSQEDKSPIPQIPFSVKQIIADINNTGLIYSEQLIKRFAFSLMTKPFVILSGLAGSGKTQLAITFAKALVENRKSQLCTVSVGADWTNREPLLGFPNALQSAQYVRPESRVLDLLIEANKDENKDKPYFLILDEMNMSYVERYFADFLSAMESKEAIPLWNGCTDLDEDDEEWDDTPTSIKLPSNLFIIGTINVDETTYMFSPKVLDRANVIEFKISADEMSSFLENMKDVNPDNIIGKAANMAASFVEIASNNDLKKEPGAIDTLKKFFGELKNVNAEFGYRSATEIFRFICQAKNNDDTAVKITDDEILDAAIVQKLLPKLHGSRKKLDPVLKQLWKLCFKKTDSESELGISSDKLPKAVFKESADKIWRMYESASANGFTSFAEA